MLACQFCSVDLVTAETGKQNDQTPNNDVFFEKGGKEWKKPNNDVWKTMLTSIPRLLYQAGR